MNKKADFLMPIAELLTTLFLLAFSIMVIIAPLFQNYDVSISSADYFEDDILASRITGSAQCLAFEDDLGRIHAGVIDVDVVNIDDTGEIRNINCFDDVGYTVVLYEPGESINTFGQKFLVRYTTDGETFDTGILLIDVEDVS